MLSMDTRDCASASASRALASALGANAAFREGQLEVIATAVNRPARVLLVQRAGWGKTLVCLLATRLLRDAGAGPTLLLSTQGALTDSQATVALRIGLRVRTREHGSWTELGQELDDNQVDLIVTAPERLTGTPRSTEALGLIAICGAHHASQWGHDYRPHFERAMAWAAEAQQTTSVLAMTAVPTQRVVSDITGHLGANCTVLQGPMTPQGLRLHTIALAGEAEKLAWLAENLAVLPGSGVIFCLTALDCARVARWLRMHGFPVPVCQQRMTDAELAALQPRLATGEVKALAAPMAMGRRLARLDTRFVVHLQPPASLAAYYEQLGCVDRGGERSYAVLVREPENHTADGFLLRGAFPLPAETARVHATLIADGPLTLDGLEARLNSPRARLAKSVAALEAAGAAIRDGNLIASTECGWEPADDLSAQLAAHRLEEMDRVREFAGSNSCLMEQLCHYLGSPGPKPCGLCSGCVGPFMADAAKPYRRDEAVRFLRETEVRVLPRRRWPQTLGVDRTGEIPNHQRNRTGRALSVYGDSGWGHVVAAGRHDRGRFGWLLVHASARLIRERWRPKPPPAWVTFVPSLRHPRLVASFARRLAWMLGLPFRHALAKVSESAEQATMGNSAHRLSNIAGSFAIVASEVLPGPVLLVDDVVASGWTITLCGVLLWEAGAGPVHPFALAASDGARLAP